MFCKGFKPQVLIWALAYILAVCLPGTSPAAAANDSPLQRNIQISVKVSNSGKQTVSNIQVQLPLISADSPYQQTIEETFNHKVAKIVEGEAGSRTADIVIDAIGPGQSETIVVDYQLNVKPDGGLSYSEDGDVQRYLQASAKIESNHSEITKKAHQLSAGLPDDMDKVIKIGAFVNSHLTYNLKSPHKNKGALSALRNREGVCEDFAALFAALCRASGIPARQVNGFADPKLTGVSWRSAQGEISLQGFRHSWAEVYLKDQGWVAVDPTFKIYPQEEKDAPVKLSASHIAQNYYDQPVKVTYRGEKLAVGWGNLLINK